MPNRWYVPVNEGDGHTESICHVLKSQALVGFEQLSVRQDSHLPDIIAVMRGEKPVVLQHDFNLG